MSYESEVVIWPKLWSEKIPNNPWYLQSSSKCRKVVTCCEGVWRWTRIQSEHLFVKLDMFQMYTGLLSTIVLDILREQTDNNLLHKVFVNVLIVCTATGRFVTQIPKSNITPSKPCLLSATLFFSPLFSNSLYTSCLISRHETPIF